MRAWLGVLALLAGAVDAGEPCDPATISALLRQESQVRFVGLSELNPLDARMAKEIEAAGKDPMSGRSFTYIVDFDGDLSIVPRKMEFREQDIAVIGSSEGGHNPLMISRAGEVRYDPVSKKLEFKPSYGGEVSAEETERMAAQVESRVPGAKVSTELKSSRSLERAIECSQILARQANAKNTWVHDLVAEWVVNVGVLAALEGSGASNRASTPEGRESIASDLAVATIMTPIGSLFGGRLRAAGITGLPRLGARLAFAEGMTLAQREVYAKVGGDEEAASRQAAFNRKYAIIRVPISELSDKFVFKLLPHVAFEACQKGSLKRILVSPGVVRFIERGGASVIYYGLSRTKLGN